MAAANKQKALTKLLAQVPKNLSESLPKNLSVLDHLLVAVIQEGTNFTLGHQTYLGLLRGYLNAEANSRQRDLDDILNEVRVSHAKELAPLLSEVPEAETKSRRLKQVLQFVFETTYGYDLELMRRKPLKQAQKQLSKVPGASGFAAAAVVQRALGGHALPIDDAMRQALVRLGALDEEEELDAARSALEHAVPKAQGLGFCLYISDLVANPKQLNQLAGPIKAPKVKASKEESPAPVKAASKSKTSASTPKKSPREKK